MSSKHNILYIGNNADYFTPEISENWEITRIENSIKATKYLQSQQKIDAIICDYTLPGNTGIFLYDWIRAHSDFDAIPFILLSKEFNVDLYKLAFNKKIDDFYYTWGRFKIKFDSITLKNDCLSYYEKMQEKESK
jgi:CheY-like chemotaxis protein